MTRAWVVIGMSHGVGVDQRVVVAETEAGAAEAYRGVVYARGDIGSVLVVPAGTEAGASGLLFEVWRRGAVDEIEFRNGQEVVL